jgi:hypothetical protein
VSARYLGYDPAGWARQGWVDRVVATNHWATTDSYPPVEIWKELFAGTKTKLDIGNEILLRPDKRFPAYPSQTLETLRGYAVSALARGADGVYLFNFMDILRDSEFDKASNFKGDVYDRMLREIGDLGVLRGKSRRHVTACADVWAEGEPAAYALPRRLDRGRYTGFRISVGEPPAEGQKAWVVAAFAAPDAIDSVDITLTDADKSTWGSSYEREPKPAPATAGEAEVRVNEVICPPDSGVTAATDKIRHPLCWRIPDGVISGSAAVVEFHGTDGTVIWLEIYIG